ncbi:MAG TPA: hypothetical protein VM557_00905, partial [Thermoanaerobaculia bacterium]|nr:hypothetical protein [Thermoanaerobaculia bacterium]
ADLGSLPPVRGADIILIGDRDPLVDRNRTRESGLTVRQIPGAHGALFSHAKPLADGIAALLESDTPSTGSAG